MATSDQKVVIRSIIYYNTILTHLSKAVDIFSNYKDFEKYLKDIELIENFNALVFLEKLNEYKYNTE